MIDAAGRARPDPREAARFAAVMRRDCRKDGTFLYAVATTGVYCRPSCPARKPKRANVAFFDNAAAARSAGYRACRRCRPDAHDAGAPWLVQAIRAIEAAECCPRLADLSEVAGLTPWHLQRAFKAATGLSPRRYWLACCAKRMRASLASGASVTRALHEAGFTSASQFYANVHAVTGMKPKAVKSGGDGTHIGYATGRCSLGRILIAATHEGVCAVHLGDSDESLVAELRARFPNADIARAGDAFAKTAKAMIAAAEHPWERSGLPLDIRGTAFQQRVWAALREIPAGETATYAQIAGRLGAPKAVRAVAAACAANPIAILVPCHRVVRSDGSLAGYRWGPERKAALLAKESSRKPRKG